MHTETVLLYDPLLTGRLGGKKLLGDNPENIVVTDQYAGYHYIDADHRQLCWAHILRNMNALAESWGTNKTTYPLLNDFKAACL